MEKIKIGFTIGDVNGIGLEVVLKALSNRRIMRYCIPVIYGSMKVVTYHKNILGDDMELKFNSISNAERLNFDKVNVVNCWEGDVAINIGSLRKEGGIYAIKSLDAATNDLKAGLIDTLVTAPIHKKAMQDAGFEHIGHTEYLTKSFDATESLMLLVNDNLRISTVTNHIPIKDVVDAIDKDLILRKLRIFKESLIKDFGIERPTIAVLGLNPHAGDDGSIGKEDSEIVRPAIIEAKKKGMLAMGPFPADGFFGSGEYAKYDGILAMYHDQGLIPFKALSFGNGVNFTAGLSGIRTSPDHGTAFEIAGKNEANPSSLRHAIYTAIDIFRTRSAHTEMHLNPVKKHKEFSKSDR